MNEPSSHKFLAGFVILIALAVHAGALFLTHGYTFNPPVSASSAYMENSQASGHDSDDFFSRKEEAKRKNEQLAELFQQMKPSVSENQRPQKALAPLAEISKSSPEMPPEATKQPTDVEVLFASDQYLTQELIRATEMAQGVVEPSAEQVEMNSPSIKAGKESGFQSGVASLNRSGLLKDGRTDTLLGSGPTLGAASELGKISQAQLEALYPSGQDLSGQGGGAGFYLNPLGTIASSNDFTLDIQVAPRTHGPGYLFRLELVPKPSVKFRRIGQNFFFLIDRSHSIRFARYAFTREAVMKALSLLRPGDTFNLLVFDDRVVPFAEKNVPWNETNVANARAFLSQQKYGGLFATTDLYSSLGKIVPAAVAENEVNTAILLSDGDTYLSSAKQRDSIERWTRQNLGKVSLYTLASGKGNNLALLDVLCFFNKGLLYYCAEDQEIESSLFKLMEALQNPIGKEMTLTAITPRSDLEIALFPANESLPNLYEQSPFVVYGTINRLHDFHLFFQGKYYEKTLDIKQAVSFAQAKQGDAASLEKKLAVYQAYASYAEFLKDGQMVHLSRAKQLLQPYKIGIAFQ